MPKRAKADPRVGKGYVYQEQSEYDVFLDQANRAVLPGVPIRESFGYGAQGPVAMPKRALNLPTNNLMQMAQAIDATKEITEKNVISKARAKAKEARRSRRDPTPDETQLFDTLREAAERGERDSPTPPPPVPRAVSTDPSSEAEPPLSRSGFLRSTPDRESSVDNASVISWNLERRVHEDNLQRTRPGKSRGVNISAPPRRFSGIVNLVQDTVEEDAENEENEEIEEESHPLDLYDSDQIEQVEGWTSRARTIIPQMFRSEPREQTPEPTSSKEGLIRRLLSAIEVRRPFFTINWAAWIRVGLVALLSLSLGIFIHSGLASELAEKFRPSFSFGDSIPPNATDPAVVQNLQSQISKMNSQMTSLSRELGSVRKSRDSNPTDAAVPIAYNPQQPMNKINFLSKPLGAIVDPYLTSPTIGDDYPGYVRFMLKFSPIKPRKSKGPLTALIPWQEVGDCWCSVPHNGEIQLSVILGRPIVPDEVIVEHVPFGATLDPGCAPRDIEVWARYRVSQTKRSWYSMFAPWSSNDVYTPIDGTAQVENNKDEMLSDTLHDVLINSISISNTFESQSAYSDDPHLGPNFYRIGKFEYDMSSPHNIQRFPLNTIIDIPAVRVDKVVFRVTSNWGSDMTCIYRFRLHGHI